MKKKIIAFTVFLILGFSLFSLAKAFNFTTPLPQTCPVLVNGVCPITNGQEANSIAAYIVRIYELAVAVAGILAVGMIVVGAIYISVSGDSPDKKNEGRGMIMSAIWGLVLLLGSYIILNTINPQLTSLKEPYASSTPHSSYAFSIGAGSNPCPDNNGSNPQSCYFDPSIPLPDPANAACVFNDKTKCTAVDRVTPACQKRPCIAKNATILPRISSVPIRENPPTCAGGQRDQNGRGQCFLESLTLNAFYRLYDALSQSSVFSNANAFDENAGWRITEAFPPVSDHTDACHYNGRCFDFAMIPPSSPPYDTFCAQLRVVYAEVRSLPASALIESAATLPPALAYCTTQPANSAGYINRALITTTPLTTGFHVHIQL